MEFFECQDDEAELIYFAQEEAENQESNYRVSNGDFTILRMELSEMDSPGGGGDRICRICHEDEGAGGESCNPKLLISPCSCTGTVGLIHLSCLEKWLNTANTDACELCRYIYKTTRVRRSYKDYILSQSNLGIRSLLADLICFLLLTPLLVGSTYLCALGASRYFGKDGWEAMGLILLSGFLIGVYLVWCFITVRYHFISWKFWQEKHQLIQIDETSLKIKVQR